MLGSSDGGRGNRNCVSADARPATPSVSISIAPAAIEINFLETRNPPPKVFSASIPMPLALYQIKCAAVPLRPFEPYRGRNAGLLSITGLGSDSQQICRAKSAKIRQMLANPSV